MKTFKKFAALLVAALMVLAMAVPAMAAAEDKTIKLGGLAAADTATYRPIITIQNAQWAWNTSYIDTTKFTSDPAVLLKKVVGDNSVNPAVEGVIDEEAAREIAAAIKGTGTAMTVAEGVASATNLDPGLYFVQAVASEAGTIYNPAFLAVQIDNTGSEITLPLNYANSGAAKKQTTDITKKAGANADQDATTQDVGDEIEFTITTTLPVFLDNYTAPFFKVSDAMTSGLSFVDGSLKMKLATGDATAPTSNKWQTSGETPKDIATFNKTDAQNWDVTFDSEYLKTITTPTAVVITYKAIITDAAKNVNAEDNTATIEYSRNPDQASDHGTKDDSTKHYTFGVNFDLAGSSTSGYKTTDFVKVGVDKNGDPIITETATYSNGETQTNPLADAEFILYDANKQPYSNGPTNQTIKDGQSWDGTTGTNFKTGADGKFGFSGLDAGTYYLHEVKAPAGYMLLTRDIPIVIEATIEEGELTGFTITVDGKDATKSSYKINQGEKDSIEIEEVEGNKGDVKTEIENTQGVDLPSTGGMGTTILYVAGSILVLGAAVIMITRRRVRG